MSDSLLQITVRLSADETLVFEGTCLGRVVAMDHDNSVRRQFSVYSHETGFIAECIDRPGDISARSRAARCPDIASLYDFYGNEPLANYLYGVLHLNVPGLRVVHV